MSKITEVAANTIKTAAIWTGSFALVLFLGTALAQADEGAQVFQPDYGFRWGEKGCRKRFPVGCGRYWPAPPLKCKYIRWGCPRSAFVHEQQ